MALSNFLHSRYLSPTAYLEVNPSREISALSGTADHTEAFRHQGVVYYPEATLRQISEVKQKRYQYIILDFGRPSSRALEEFARCDHRIVLADTAGWKARALDRFADDMENNNIAWFTCKTVCMRGKKSDCAKLAKDYGIRVISAPDLIDPFHVTSETFSFFEKILKGD